jgi:hypothetical protein
MILPPHFVIDKGYFKNRLDSGFRQNEGKVCFRHKADVELCLGIKKIWIVVAMGGLEPPTSAL